MRKEDVKIGMKVVPFQKTTFSNLDCSNAWKRAKNNKQSYLYVTLYDDQNYVLNDTMDKDGGDYFNSCDFNPYIEKSEIKGRLVNTLDEEIYGTVGIKTPLVDINNKPLYIGDIVSIEDCDTSMVCTSRGDIMGIWGGFQRDIQDFNVKKIKSYSELKKDEECPYGVKLVLDKEETKKNKPLNKVQNIKHIINGTTTIVIIDGNNKGTARLHPEDEFNEQEGFMRAYARACGFEAEYEKTLQEYTNEELLEELKSRLKMN